MQSRSATRNDVEEVGCTYAALLLHDCGLDVTASSISVVLAAAGVRVSPVWPRMFADAVNGGPLFMDSALQTATAPAPAVCNAGGRCPSPVVEVEPERVQCEGDDCCCYEDSYSLRVYT
eukprot:TRINITY_DN8756_c0_g1_i1.p1 TRINITY_DN8756_c0_g1~~TRINITY_DN8756_c0_g1_i1.p1  ORF type:complete len:119 (-),score=14.75 TRINITY_DN8756_c0_g1_i1:240-596(-)